MTILNKITDYIMQLICSEKGYISLFKAMIFLLGFSLLAISQTGKELYDKDITSYRALVSIEVGEGKPFKDVTCATLDSAKQIECKVAKYQRNTVISAIDLLNKIVELSFYIAFGCGLLSIIGFLAHPFFKESSD